MASQSTVVEIVHRRAAFTTKAPAHPAPRSFSEADGFQIRIARVGNGPRSQAGATFLLE